MVDILGALGGDKASNASAGAIKDVTIETFEKDVLEASMQAPVVVDFWATWCGPCKQLTPALEKAVLAAGGGITLAKVDIDKNQMLASQLRIQSVPTIYGFVQGRPVDGFQGAVPESEIKAFLDRLLAHAQQGDPGQGAADLAGVFEAAEQAFDAGDVATAAQAYSQLAQATEPETPENAKALGGLARCQLAMGDHDKARQIFEMIPEKDRDDPSLSSVRAAIALADAGAGSGDAGALAQKVAQNPSDLEARFDLAEAQIGAGAMEDAVQQLLEITMRERDWRDGAAREKLLTVFDALGPTHPATAKGRRRLSSILFS